MLSIKVLDFEIKKRMSGNNVVHRRGTKIKEKNQKQYILRFAWNQNNKNRDLLRWIKTLKITHRLQEMSSLNLRTIYSKNLRYREFH